MPIKINIIVKNSDDTYINRHLSYPDSDGDIVLSPHCPKLQQLVQESKAKFAGEADEVRIKTDMVWE